MINQSESNLVMRDSKLKEYQTIDTGHVKV